MSSSGRSPSPRTRNTKRKRSSTNVMDISNKTRKTSHRSPAAAARQSANEERRAAETLMELAASPVVSGAGGGQLALSERPRRSYLNREPQGHVSKREMKEISESMRASGVKPPPYRVLKGLIKRRRQQGMPRDPISEMNDYDVYNVGPKTEDIIDELERRLGPGVGRTMSGKYEDLMRKQEKQTRRHSKKVTNRMTRNSVGAALLALMIARGMEPQQPQQSQQLQLMPPPPVAGEVDPNQEEVSELLSQMSISSVDGTTRPTLKVPSNQRLLVEEIYDSPRAPVKMSAKKLDILAKIQQEDARKEGAKRNKDAAKQRMKADARRKKAETRKNKKDKWLMKHNKKGNLRGTRR